MARAPMRRDDAWSLSIRDSSNTCALDPAWDNVCPIPRARAPVERDATLLRGSVIEVIWEPKFVLGRISIVSSWLARLSTAQNALDIGTPCSLPVLARKAGGRSSRPEGPPDPVATEDMLWARGCCYSLARNANMPKCSQPFGRASL